MTILSLRAVVTIHLPATAKCPALASAAAAAAELAAETEELRAWGARQPKGKVFEAALESFSPSNFTALYDWLGFGGCKALRVLHVNDREVKDQHHPDGGYSTRSAVVAMRTKEGPVVDCADYHRGKRERRGNRSLIVRN